MKNILALLLVLLALGAEAAPTFQPPPPDPKERAAIIAAGTVTTVTVTRTNTATTNSSTTTVTKSPASATELQPAASVVPAAVPAPAPAPASTPAPEPAPAPAVTVAPPVAPVTTQTNPTVAAAPAPITQPTPAAPAAAVPAPAAAPTAAPSIPTPRTTAVPTRRPASTPAAPAAPSAPAASSTGTSEVSAKAINAAGDTIPAGMMRFQAMPLEQVLDIYADLVGRTLLRPSSLPAASITIRAQTDLTRAEALAALDSVLGMNGIATVKFGDKFMKVVPTTSVNTEGAPVNDLDPSSLPDVGGYITHVVQLKYSKPSEVAQALGTFSKIQGSVLPLDSNGILIIRDFTENVKRMLELIDKIDVNIPSEFVSEVIPIRYATATEIASALNGVGGTTSGSIGSAATGTTGGGATGRAAGTTSPFGGNRLGSGTTGTGGANGYNQNGGNRFGQQAGGANPAGGAAAAGGQPQTFQQRLANILRSSGTGGAGDVQLIGPNKIIADERTNSLLVFATRQDMDMIKDIISKLDVVLAQVLIEAVILDVTLGDQFDFGVSGGQRPVHTPSAAGGGSFGSSSNLIGGAAFLNNLLTSFTTNITTNIGGFQTNVTALFSQSTNANYLGTGGGLGYFGQFGGSWDVAINAVAGNNKGKVLARPRIQTSHNAPASFFVGETQPYVTGTSVDYNGSNRSQYSQTQIGITLSVTPLINSEGLVVMDIQQQVQQVGGYTKIDGNDVPITQDQNASAKVSVRNGDTIVMGGFIQNTKQDSKSGIPYLQDIPFLGGLFRTTSTKSNRRELLVMIRPTVLSTPEAAALQPRIERDRLPAIKEAEIEFNREDAKLLKAADKKAKADEKRLAAEEAAADKKEAAQAAKDAAKEAKKARQNP